MQLTDIHRRLTEARRAHRKAFDAANGTFPLRREREFRDSLPIAAKYAAALDCDLVHVMAGVLGASTDYADAERVYVQNLRHAAQFFARMMESFGKRCPIW